MTYAKLGFNEIATPRADEERIGHLLDVAAEVFLDVGYARASVGEIARRAHASKGTFYRRFPTKNELFAAVIKRRADEAFEDLASILLPDAEPRDVLRAIGAKLMACVLSKDSINLLRLVYMESRQFPEVGKAFYELGPRRGRELLASYLRDLSEKRVLVRMDASLAAEQFLDLVTGELVRRCALGIKPAFSEAEREKRLNAGVETFLRAYAAR